MNLMNGVTVAAADGGRKNAAKGELTVSSLVNLEAKVEAGAAAPNAGAQIKITVAGSKHDLAAADAPDLLKTPAATLICELNLDANGAAYIAGPAFVAPGDYLYGWVSTRNLGQDVTLTLDANER